MPGMGAARRRLGGLWAAGALGRGRLPRGRGRSVCACLTGDGRGVTGGRGGWFDGAGEVAGRIRTPADEAPDCPQWASTGEQRRISRCAPLHLRHAQGACWPAMPSLKGGQFRLK